jgi:hypothetical protein
VTETTRVGAAPPSSGNPSEAAATFTIIANASCRFCAGVRSSGGSGCACASGRSLDPRSAPSSGANATRPAAGGGTSDAAGLFSASIRRCTAPATSGSSPPDTGTTPSLSRPSVNPRRRFAVASSGSLPSGSTASAIAAAKSANSSVVGAGPGRPCASGRSRPRAMSASRRSIAARSSCPILLPLFASGAVAARSPDTDTTPSRSVAPSSSNSDGSSSPEDGDRSRWMSRAACTNRRAVPTSTRRARRSSSVASLQPAPGETRSSAGRPSRSSTAPVAVVMIASRRRCTRPAACSTSVRSAADSASSCASISSDAHTAWSSRSSCSSTCAVVDAIPRSNTVPPTFELPITRDFQNCAQLLGSGAWGGGSSPAARPNPARPTYWNPLDGPAGPRTNRHCPRAIRTGREGRGHGPVIPFWYGHDGANPGRTRRAAE